MIRRSEQEAAPAERGFIIVGVVMFVLALTILGLSLFGLSGYEAQFTRRSMDAEQAFFSACNGIEHAKFVLVERESLGAVGDASLFPDPNIVYARARLLTGPGDDTLSSITGLALGTPIEIRVLAQVGRERRMLQGDFTPGESPNLYKRLISASEYVHVKPFWAPGDTLYSSMDEPYGTSAGVWQGLPNVDWMLATQISPSLVHSLQPVPTPELGPYYARFWSLATAIEGPIQPGGARRFDLGSGGGTIPGGPPDVQFFKTEQDPHNNAVDPDDNLKFSVIAGLSGVEIDLQDGAATTAIWLLDHGAYFTQGVVFEADPGDVLVIVSWTSPVNGPAPYTDPAGIWFFSGLDSRNLPLILVTPAQIVIEQFNTPLADNRAYYLSLFGRSAWLAGCRRQGGFTNTTYWLHPAAHTIDAPNGRIDQLWDLGALPNSDGGTRMRSIAGTWTELDPDNPPLFD